MSSHKPKTRRLRPESHSAENKVESVVVEAKDSVTESGKEDVLFHQDVLPNFETVKEESAPSVSSESESSFQSSSSQERIQFEGADLLRHRFPKSFEFAEVLVTNWVKDGNFQDLPVPNDMAKMAVVQGLRSAKQLEKNIMNSPAFEKLALQTMETALHVQARVEQWRKKFMGK